MKFILASCLLCFSCTLSAQSIEDLVLEAGNLFLQGQYEKAIPAAKKAATAVKTEIGEDNVLYLGLLTIEASSYKFTFQFLKAEPVYLDLIERVRKLNGESDEGYTASLNNLAGLYENMGQYEKAEPLYLKVIETRKRIAGETDTAYLTGLNGLAALYHSMGLYARAEPLYLQVMEGRKKILGQNHNDYATSLNNLATLYTEIGQYEKAEPLYSASLDIQKKGSGEYTAGYATTLNNLSSLWQNMEQYAKAETGFNRSMEIREKVLGIKHSDYAASLNNLATLYAKLGQYQKAEPLIIRASETWKNIVGVNSPAYATSLNNLAAFYRKTQTHYDKAELLYLEAIRLRKTILGENHPFYAESLNDLALLYMQSGQYKKAEPLFLSSSAILMKNIAGTFSILSEKEKGKYLDYNREMIECNNSFLYNYPQVPASIIQNNYNLELGFKSLSLTGTKNMLELVRNSRDTAIIRIFDQWVTAKNILAKQYSLPVSARMTTVKSLEAEAENLEKDLNRRSSAFSSQQKALRVTMQDVQKNLAADEAAVEFVKFRLYNNKWTDSVIYGAYILHKKDVAPRFIPLCEKKQLQQLFDSAGSSVSKLVKSFYRGLEIKSKEARLGTELYKLIWEPLEPYLKGVKKIAYSPAGKLYSVAFQALPVDSTTILMDKYQLQQYTSTRQISLRTAGQEMAKPRGIVLFGDALFTMDSLQLVNQRKKKTSAEPDPNSIVLSKSRGNETGAWVSLPGTAEEIKKIGQLFEENKISTRSFLRETASEENLKSLSGSDQPVIHIATHGFFLPEAGKKKSGTAGGFNVYSLAEDPLLRSGLVLAGGNYAWSGRTPVEGMEDGIVTAYEISRMNLSKTELLVLSACETALGDIKGSEGVFGLQRGFKMAGVKKMIVSLWQVPDKETAELMTSFYAFWMTGKTISESFYQAQAMMRKKYPAYYWAAFVLVE